MPFISEDEASRWAVPQIPAHLLEAPFSTDADAPWWVRANVPAEVLDPPRDLEMPSHLLRTPGSAGSTPLGSVMSDVGLARLPFGAALVEPEGLCPCCVEVEADQAVPFNFHHAPDTLADEFARHWRLREEHTARAWRVIGAMHAAIGQPGCEFVGDDLALLTNTHPRSGQHLAVTALQACQVPELIALVEAGALGTKHAETLLTEVGRWTEDPEQAARVLQLTLDRCRDRAAVHGWPTPAALKKRLQTAAILLDLRAAEKRKQNVADKRGVAISQTGIGAAMLTVEGPDLMIVQMMEAIRARAQALGRIPGDTRSFDQRMFDAADELLTVDADGGPSAVPATGLHGEPVSIRVRGVEIAVLTPYSVTQGGELELAEIVGLGPILPSTARELLTQCDSIRRVAVDAVTGEVLAVDDKTPGPGRGSANTDPHNDHPHNDLHTDDLHTDDLHDDDLHDDDLDDDLDDDGPSGPPEEDPVAPASPTAGAPAPERDDEATPPGLAPAVLARLRELVNTPVIWRDLHSDRYRVPGRLRRFVELRDRTCTFPACTVPGRYCDVDHREEWPRGATHHENCHCLCRRHHRAKQAYFTVTLDTRTGDTVWTCPDGREYRRPPPRY